MFSAKNLLYGFARFFQKEHVEEDAKDTPEEMEKAWKELAIPISKVVIDPTNMKPEQGAWLGQQKKLFLKTGLNIIDQELDGKKSRVYLHLDQGLVYRTCESKPDDYRYEVVGKEIGTGAFSHVYLSAGTLVPQADGSLRFKPPLDDKNNPVEAIRIIKHQTHLHPKFPPQKAAHEISLGKRTFHLGGKALTVLDTHPPESFMVENLIPGKDLFTLIEADHGDAHLHPEEREELALEVLYAIREQMHARGILHRDIKAENIIIIKEKGRYTAYIIDLGLSRLVTEKDTKEVLGTIGYVAPEILAGQGATEKSEVFAAGIVESLIWGGRTPPIIEAVVNNKLDEPRAKLSAENYKFPDLFSEVDGFDSSKTAITAWLHKMIHKDPAQRLSFDGAIAELEKIVFERKKQATRMELHHDLDAAHLAGILLRKELEKERRNVAYALQRKIKGHINESWHPEIYSEFTSRLHIRALYRQQAKSGVINKIDNIIRKYEQAHQQVKSKCDEITELYANSSPDKEIQFTTARVLANCRYILAKCAASRLTLDEMVVLTAKLNKCLAKADLQMTCTANRIKMG